VAGRRLFLAALAGVAALILPAAEAGAQQRRAARPPAARPAAPQDWTRIAVRTPEGGVRIGNPAAVVKLIEYGSITCPHCAAFANGGGTAGLYAHVRSGRVSWEYRPYMIFPTDPAIFAALGCLPPRQYFGAVEQLYATQQSWASLAQAHIDANRSQLQGMGGPQRSIALFRASQVEGLFRARGLSAAQVNACITNPANLQRVAEISRQGAQRYGVQGTPTFFINGAQTIPVEFWSELEPLLIQAGARGR
jgi:protein-disulfide isomerase